MNATDTEINRNTTHTQTEGNNMKLINKKLGMLLLGIWLIMTGLVQVIQVPIPALGMILSLLAMAAGALILLSR